MSAVKKASVNYSEYTAVVKEVSKIVSEIAGIQLHEKQFPMVENRLKSRMIRLSLKNPDQYLEYLRSHFEEESKELLSLLTTHHTYFFREFTHFEFLLKSGLHELIKSARDQGRKKIRVWSAAASRGQEVYSLAMFLDLHLKHFAPDFDYEVWGTDVDPQSISIAKNGVYAYKDLKQVPSQYLGNHWSRGTGEIAAYVKAKKSLSAKVRFTTLNLVQPVSFQGHEKFDLIFCRNVFIYFNQDQIKSITQYLLGNLYPGGLLVTGISEPLNGMGLKLNPVGPSVYRDGIQVTSPKKPLSSPSSNSIKPPAPLIPDMIRVLCVDDSPSILTLLKRVLTPQEGFEIVGTATNGLEAIEFLKKTSVDLVTLDIHMPEMNGIEYLRSNMSPQHPPVIMISSVNRENSDSALQAMKLGAVDYIEKPTLADLSERGDEIRMKAKMALLAQKNVCSRDIGEEFKQSFKISRPEDKIQVFYATLTDLPKIGSLISGFDHQTPPLLVVLDVKDEVLKFAFDDLKSRNSKIKLSVSEVPKTLGQVSLFSFSSSKETIEKVLQTKSAVSVVFGLPTGKIEKFILSQPSSFLYVEDLGLEEKKKVTQLVEVASAFAPLTSYWSIIEEQWK